MLCLSLSHHYKAKIHKQAHIYHYIPENRFDYVLKCLIFETHQLLIDFYDYDGTPHWNRHLLQHCYVIRDLMYTPWLLYRNRNVTALTL